MNSKRRDLYNKKIKYEVDSITMSYLEALHFDFVGYEHIMKNILLKHKDNPNYSYNEDTFNLFMDKYREISRKYNVLKSEIIREYVPKEYANESFIFDFETECLILDEQECAGGCCGCK